MEYRTKDRNEIKIVVVGNSGTGKTSFVNRWVKNTFTENYKATISSEFSFKIFEDNGTLYRIQLWDLAGMDQNICITKVFSKDAHGVIVFSDVTNEKSLQESVKWKSSVDESTKFIDDDYLPSILIRNKIDLLDENGTNDDEQVKEFAEKNNFLNVFKCSCKLDIQINEAMEYLISKIIERLDKCFSKGKFETERSSIILRSSKSIHNTIDNQSPCC